MKCQYCLSEVSVEPALNIWVAETPGTKYFCPLAPTGTWKGKADGRMGQHKPDMKSIASDLRGISDLTS